MTEGNMLVQGGEGIHPCVRSKRVYKGQREKEKKKTFPDCGNEGICIALSIERRCGGLRGGVEKEDFIGTVLVERQC